MICPAGTTGDFDGDGLVEGLGFGAVVGSVLLPF
jgi:hypothetical protein